MTTSTYIPIDITEIRVNEPLPANLYVSIDSRYIVFRGAGDVLTRQIYDRLELKGVRALHVLEEDLQKFKEWIEAETAADPKPTLPQANAEFPSAREDANRKLLDIFQSAHPESVVVEAIAASKRLVGEVMKFPYAVQTLAQLQTFSRGTVDHSVNVSILSVYLAMQMGYSHSIILQHVGAGALLHDIGKRKVAIQDEDATDAYEAKMKEHPTFGLRILESVNDVPDEVKMIVAQHHEYHDGTGYPKRLRGNNIYDLARIVAIANQFDELVIEGKGPLVERQKAAILQLDQLYLRKFEQDKLDKALKILKFGI